jgi:hypothetical protein
MSRPALEPTQTLFAPRVSFPAVKRPERHSDLYLMPKMRMFEVLPSYRQHIPLRLRGLVRKQRDSLNEAYAISMLSVSLNPTY